jgi:hypothetical protein
MLSADQFQKLGHDTFKLDDREMCEFVFHCLNEKVTQVEIVLFIFKVLVRGHEKHTLLELQIQLGKWVDLVALNLSEEEFRRDKERKMHCICLLLELISENQNALTAIERVMEYRTVKTSDNHDMV